MLIAEVAAASADVAATSSRLAKRARLAEVIAAAGPDEVAIVVAWLAGDLPQRQVGVGWASLRRLPEPAEEASLPVRQVDSVLTSIKVTTGKGSQTRRAELLTDLFALATEPEQAFLRRLLGGELRQGALLGVMTDAIAQANGVSAAAVRRAAMLGGQLPGVAAAIAVDGVAGLAQFRLTVGRPVGPMLAQTAGDVAEALQRLGGTAAFETKLDGARVQLHRSGEDVRVFTRSLDEVTERLPELVQAALALPVNSLIADGEAIALRPNGRPHPFQVTSSRFGRHPEADQTSQAPRLNVFLFDLLHLDGVDLLDEPEHVRAAALARLVPAQQRVTRVVTSDPAEAQALFEQTISAGHEGLVAKSTTAAYEAGRRGSGWLKIKPVHTLDLVVLAIEWGSGRRSGKLSNVHLGARDSSTGEFVMLGKTFKGMTDDLLAWQTERFLAIADGPTDGYVVRVRPEQVVEIAFDGVQSSSRYPGGVALRFARVVGYRKDKTADDADTIDTVRGFYDG